MHAFFRAPRTRVIVSVFVVIAAFAAVWLWLDSEKNSSSEKEEALERVGGINATAMLSAPEFAQREQAERIINQTQGKLAGTQDYEMILTGIVPSPDAPALVYFATSSSDPESMFTGVYLYDTVAQRWQRIYKRTAAAEEGKAPRILRVLAVQEKELILLSDLFGRKTSRCESLWLQDPASLMTLDIEKPYDDFKPFVLPPALRDAEKARMDTCLARP